MKTLWYALGCSIAVLAGPSTVNAAEVWRGDFETGDLSQWSFLLNNEINGTDYAFAQGDLLAEGAFAGRIELHNDAEWGNGLKRVELQHRPDNGRTAEGATTWFAWSFYLPEALPSDPSQQIGYWESNNSFQQVMAFEVRGQDIGFYTRRPNNVEQWQADGVVTPEQWHRIAMGVTWSTNQNQGSVDVWFDGEQVVDGGAAQTLADNNSHFTQVGLLRGAIEFDDVPVIIIDDAVEGDTLDDVRPFDFPGEDGGSSSSSDGGGESSSSGGGEGDTTEGGPVEGSTSDETGTTPPPPPPPPGTGGGMGSASAGADSTGGTDSGASAGADEESGGCGCRSDRGPGASGFGLLMVVLLGRRRRARHVGAA